MAAISADGWIAHFVKQNYDGDGSVIPLRGPAGARHPVQMIYSDPTCPDYADTPLLRRRPICTRCWRALPARCKRCG